jgi:hypothetical protein
MHDFSLALAFLTFVLAPCFVTLNHATDEE